METDRVGLRPFLITVSGIFVLEGAGALLIGADWRYPMAVLGLVRAAEIGWAIGVFLKWGRGPADLGLGRGQISAGLKQGMLWSAGFGILVLIGFGLLSVWGQTPLTLFRVRLPGDPFDRFWYILVGGVVAPLAEEILFRGVLYGFFRRWGIVPALGLSSLLFVSAHTTHGFPVTQAVGAILFAAAYETEGKLMAPITIHVTGNLALFSLSFLS